MQPRINMLSLGVNNFSETILFYQDTLGFKRILYSSDELDNDNAAIFEMDGTWLSICKIQQHATDLGLIHKEQPALCKTPSVILCHNLRSKEEVDRFLNDLTIKGVNIINPAAETNWGGYGGHFQDPEGYVWGVFYNPFFWPGPNNN